MPTLTDSWYSFLWEKLITLTVSLITALLSPFTNCFAIQHCNIISDVTMPMGYTNCVAPPTMASTRHATVSLTMRQVAAAMGPGAPSSMTLRKVFSNAPLPTRRWVRCGRQDKVKSQHRIHIRSKKLLRCSLSEFHLEKVRGEACAQEYAVADAWCSGGF